MNALVESMKKHGFLTQKKVEDAIRETPRHLFVPQEFVEQAYDDIPLTTKKGQTISQPRVVARMTEWLDVKNSNKVLEVGTGSGWQSAILSKMVGNGKVYSIERFSELAEFAKKNHRRAKIKNVEVICADGSLGLPEKAPYDRIIITAACAQIPKPLLGQLAPNGLLIAPVGKGTQSMILLRKTEDGIIREKADLEYKFVPLIGQHGISK